MGSDIVVALKEASANGTTLFALNQFAAPNQRHCLQFVPGHFHEPGQLVPIANLAMPQVRQTYSALGFQANGAWGFTHGVNEHRVAVGATQWQSRLGQGTSALDGPDLVRLALERSRSAMSAVEILADLLQRHGQKHDHIYLLADADESYVLEACGHYWALLECGHSRVVTGAAMIRQDWRRLAPGLASHVIDNGWWQDDGSKIDFVRILGENTESSKNAQKRWGRATLTLSQQNGAIDLHFLRHMLADHYAANRDLIRGEKSSSLASSFLVELQKSDLPIVAWVALGAPNVAVYFPICLSAEIPAVFGPGLPMMTTIEERTHELAKLASGKDRTRLTQALERLQTKFDQDVEEFLARSHESILHGRPHLIGTIATEMMQHHVDLFDKEYRRLFGVEEKSAPKQAVAEEMLFYA